MKKEGLITKVDKPARRAENPLATNFFTIPVTVDLDPVFGTVTYSALCILPKSIRANMSSHVEPNNPTPVDEIYFPLRGSFRGIKNGRHALLKGAVNLNDHKNSDFRVSVEGEPTLHISSRDGERLGAPGFKIQSGTVHGNYSIEGEGGMFSCCQSREIQMI